MDITDAALAYGNTLSPGIQTQLGVCSTTCRRKTSKLLTTMLDSVRQFIERSQAFFDVLPYYILLEERPVGVAPKTRRILAGFDIGLYILGNGHESADSSENELVSAIVETSSETALRHSHDSCSIDVMPLTSEFVLMPDNKRQIEPWTELRIRITHARGLQEPAAEPEETALKEVERQLQTLGVKQGKSR